MKETIYLSSNRLCTIKTSAISLIHYFTILLSQGELADHLLPNRHSLNHTSEVRMKAEFWRIGKGKQLLQGRGETQIY